MGVRIRILIVAVTFLLVIFWKSERSLLITESADVEQQNIKRNPPVKVYAPSNSTSNVAICVILKNETLYLDEWIDFNIALGFSPIYMYDNSLTFDLMSMPLPNSIYSWYETREEIHEHIKLMHYPIAGVQEKAYERCIKEDAANSTYVALIDVDEFLVLKTFDNVVDFMDHHCSELECGELSINWKMMGTSGEKHYTPLPITKRNVHGQKYGTIKVIVRPSYVADNLKWWHSVALKRVCCVCSMIILSNYVICSVFYNFFFFHYGMHQPLTNIHTFDSLGIHGRHTW